MSARRRSHDEQKGENGRVAGADIRSNQQYTTACRQTLPRRGGVHAPRQGAPDEEVERHEPCLSNNGSTSEIGDFRPTNRPGAARHAEMSACGERKGVDDRSVVRFDSGPRACTATRGTTGRAPSDHVKRMIEQHHRNAAEHFGRRRCGQSASAHQAAALLSRDPAVFVQPCRLTIALIQIGAKGEVQPFETG